MNALTHPADTDTQLAALTGHAGIAPLTHGWIRVTGSDRLRWLSGMMTNGIQQQALNTGTYNFILSAQGRIQGDCNAFVREDDVLLATSPDQLANLIALLDRFIIMDDVELTDVSADWHGFGLSGPDSAGLLRSIGIDADGLAPIALRSLMHNGVAITLIAAYSPGVPRFGLWTSSLAETAILREAFRAAGAVPCDAEAAEAFRILNGIPRFGTDIRDKDLPQETAQDRALHFAKGCYIGQEIVERIRSRGAVHRTFTGFTLEGPLPASGTALAQDGKAVGEITSAAAIGGKNLALGYIRREALVKKEPITYADGTATPATLPFTL